MALGYLAPIPVLYLTQPAIRQDLKLTEDQQAAIPEARGFARGRAGGAAAVPANGRPLHEKVLELLSAEQLLRYQAILLQGFAMSEGPATIFRLKFVIDALAPTEMQQKQLLQIVQEDTRAYLRIPIAELADRQQTLDENTAARLDAVLTADQREKLAKLLGEPAEFLDEPQPAVPAPG